MMVELVELYKSEITCDSQMVAKKFGYKHVEIARTIRKLIKQYTCFYYK